MSKQGREGTRSSASRGCPLALVSLVIMVPWAEIAGLQLLGREREECR